MKQIVVSESVRADVAALLLEMEGHSKMKTAKILVKSFNADKKLNAFFNAKFESGLTIFTKEASLEKLFKAIADHGTTDDRRKQALVIAMRDADVEADVKAKIKELTLDGTLALNKEQQEKLASKAVEYRNFLKDGMTRGLTKIGLYTGAFEVVEVEEPAVAEQPKEEAEAKP